MELFTIPINWWAILAGVVVSIVLGMLWYSPLLFGKKWIALMGWSPGVLSEKKQGAQWSYVASTISSLVLAVVLSLIVGNLLATTFWQGALFGVLTWLGFVVPTSLSTVVYEQRKLGLYLIYIGYELVRFALVGGIVAVWR